MGFLMAFLLLARSTDDSLTLLSRKAFGSRQEALSALGAITADASFDAWDDEVLLLDIDAGTPVLLVRPAASAGDTATPSAPAELEESSTFSAVADEGPIEVALEADVAAEQREAQQDEVLASEEPQGEEPTVADIDIDEAARSFIAEAVAENVGVILEEPEPAASDDEVATSLLEALARTTVKMEADGIVAPESVGMPSEVAEAPGSAEQTESAEPVVSEVAAKADSAPEEGSAADELEAIAEELGVIEPEPQPKAQPESPTPPAPEPPAWPWDVTPETAAPQEQTAERGSEPVEPDQPVPEAVEDTEEATPAETESEAEADQEAEVDQEAELSTTPAETGVVLEGLEEPAIDDGGSLITSTIDDEGFAAARPVILGAYGERAADVEIDDEEAVGPIEGRGEEAEPEPESDFIIIGEGSGSAEVSVPAAEPEPSPLSSYTCNDCVYLETCPNKDQRRPEDCGSFQWK